MPLAPTQVSAEDYTRAILNILEDFSDEREHLGDTQKAVLNILDDFAGEKTHLELIEKAVLNILEDFATEQARIVASQRAILNILDDFGEEKRRLEETQRAVLNILDDFEDEKGKVEAVNQMLLHRTEELAWSNAELEQFAYVASHDLKEPLRMVSSFVTLLQKRYEGRLDAKADRYIYFVVDGVRRMQELIEGLLEYSRAGRHEIAFGPVDMNAVRDQALLNLRQAIAETGAQIVAEPLPTLFGNALQLTQVIQNLVANALKFRRTGAIPHVRITCRRSGDVWIFSVADDGIGLDTAYADKIFNIFQRLHLRTEYPGTGIGLAVCKKVVERHGGRIWVASSPGQGADFQFTLPVEGARRS